MADQNFKHPQGAQLAYPDGSLHVYFQASEDFEKGTYVELNVNGRICKFKGGLRFPPGIIMETVPKEWWTFIMTRAPMPKQEKPVVG